MKTTDTPKADAQSFLASGSVGRLLFKFAVPAALSGLIGAIYNIVDQIFIGHSIGILGNAATNVAFPVVMIATAVSLMCGVGCAAGFNMQMGKGSPEKAGRIVGNALLLMTLIGVLLAAASLIFLEPLLRLFGATEQNLPYAQSYLGITAWGLPLSIIGAGGSVIIRSDGSPRYALVSVAIGAVLNVLLDYVFMYVLDWGIAGAAWATVIGQTASGIIVIAYFFRFHTFRLKKDNFRPRARYMGAICALGMGPMVNNLSMSLVQVLLNNAVAKYGAASAYGAEIPLACVGVISKVQSIVAAIVVGIAQGVQPIISYNYGAKNYKRVIEAGELAVKVMLCFSFAVFLCCQLFPRQIVSIFGAGSEEYFAFSERYMRIFLMLICINGMQITAGNLLTSIGKARLSVFISLTRQVLFFPPLLLVLPQLFGIDGVLWSGPVADAACFAVALWLLIRERRRILELEGEAA